MNAAELKRILMRKHGCKFVTHKGGSGHQTVTRGREFRSQLPMHGSHKELGPRLLNKILKDLGIKKL